jgi:23S rRNA pseudouridine1911/1915/1917 synthase
MTILTILFEDNHCLAVAKPAPLLTQGVPPAPNLEAMVKHYLKEKYQKPGKVYLGIPHRLDRPVSGAIVFARNTKAAQRLADQFRDRQVEKIYWAAVEGNVEPDEGTWEDWLRKVKAEARTERAEPESAGARKAVLRYRRLGGVSGTSLLELRPETGRMHQIRAQAAWRGWPVLGDVQYDSTRSFGPPAELPRDRIIALHARSLMFLHPISFQPVTVVAPLPSAWSDLGISLPDT